VQAINPGLLSKWIYLPSNCTLKTKKTTKHHAKNTKRKQHQQGKVCLERKTQVFLQTKNE